jgi:hypothetical protein
MRRFFGLRVPQQTDVTTRVAPLVQALLAAPRHTPRTLKQAWSKPLEDVVLKGGVTPFPLLEWEEMEVLHLPTGLFDCQGGKPFTAVLRQHTLDLAADALDHLRLRNHNDDDVAGSKTPIPSVMLSGSPDIGKTSAFPIALLRGLMRGDAGPAPPVIVIENRDYDIVVTLTFNVANGAVTSLKSAHTRCASPRDYSEVLDRHLTTSSSVFCILDTSCRNAGRNWRGQWMLPASGLPARTVVIAGADSERYRHFRYDPSHSPLVMYMRHWTIAELLAARPHLGPEVDEKTVVKRWVKLGGVLRTVTLLLGYGDGDSDGGTGSVPYLPLVDVEAVYTNPRAWKVLETLEGARRSRGVDNRSVLTYVESTRPFREPTIGFLSSQVENGVLRRHCASVMAIIARAGTSGERAAWERAFKRLALMLITEGGVPLVGLLPSRRKGASATVPAVLDLMQ